jgi:ribosomal protein S18 acetylase RimI-like enzyme
MEITIRAAEANDAACAVPLLYSSGPAAFDYIFASPDSAATTAFLHRAFADGAGELGFRNHIVAVADEKVVGLGACFSGVNMRRFTLSGLRQIVGFYGPIRAAGVIRRALQFEKIVQPPHGAEHCVAHLGVSPEFQSHGIGAKIVTYLLDEGKKQGRRVAMLDVAVTNTRAQALYERLGFRATAERPSSLKNDHVVVPAHRRMEREI